MKSPSWRPLAVSDSDQAAAWYGVEGGLSLELEFIDALQAAVAHICEHPGMGSTRYSDLLKTQAVRLWPLKKFPYLIFYIERARHVEVVRVLHAKRDIAEWLQATDGFNSE